jgi:hypothetical protein
MEIWTKILNKMAKTRTSTLSNICFLTGFVCIVPLGLLDKHQGVSQNIFVSSMFFFWGLGGLPMVIRHDADFGLFRIEGLVAVLLGVVLMICGFALALLLL